MQMPHELAGGRNWSWLGGGFRQYFNEEKATGLALMYDKSMKILKW